MKISSPTPLKAAPLPGRLNFPKHSLTCIVKGTFELKPGRAAVAAEDQLSPTGDEFYPDDAEKSGSPRYDSDFAWHKPRADLLVVGACYVPGGRAVPSCPATFRVGDKSKTVAVLGNRRWEKHWLIWKPTEPEPFTRMDLRYENSFGGEKFAANPGGKGMGEVPDGTGGKVWPLPNLEDPAHLIAGHGERPAPAGFGPLGRMWELRQGKLGTYKGRYRQTRWPWFPEDFDWTHFNASPPDQQLEGYLRGDERLAFENLHPKHPRYECQLPGIRVRCFLNRRKDGDDVEVVPAGFDEVQMQLDTLWVDMEAEKLVLVWRGWTPVSSEDHEEIQDWYYVSEPLAEPPASLEHHWRQFRSAQAGEEMPFEPEAPPPPPEPAQVPGFGPAQAAAREKEETKKKIEAQTAVLNAQLGLDKLPPGAQKQVRASQAKLIERLAENDSVKAAGMEQAAQQEELHAALRKLGLDPNNLPPLTDKARAEQTRFLSELGLSGGALQGDTHMGGLTAMLGAVLGKAAKDPENLEPMLAEVRKLKAKLGLSEQEPEPEAPKPKPPLTRESVQARLAERGSFEGADLRGLDLSGLDLQGADFSGANLAAVPLRKTKLQQANFSKANLTCADLTEADLTNSNAAAADFSGARLCKSILKEADLAAARLVKADLTQAVLDGAILEDARLSGACLKEASAKGAFFARAELTNANFQKGVAVKADFTRAILSQADFQGSDLTEASLMGAVGHQLNLTGAVLTKLRAGGGCDFTGARLVEAQGNGSIWKGANLTGTDFRYAHMEEAIFTSACLKQSNLSAANLKFSRFNKANLTGAKLVKMNLFQGNLEKANLTQADLSGSNLYEAEFLDAVLDRTVTEGACLKMTKFDLQ